MVKNAPHSLTRLRNYQIDDKRQLYMNYNQIREKMSTIQLVHSLSGLENTLLIG